MATETELKIEVGDLQLLDCILTCAEIRAVMQGGFTYIPMQTTYFDTEDHALSEKMWMLRIRSEDGRSVVTLKTKAEGRSRGEWETDGEILEDAIEPLINKGAPKELAEIAEKELLAICGAKFTRIFTTLRFEDGTECDLCGDVGELFAGGKTAPVCELELELRSGSEQRMLQFGTELMEKYHVKEGKLSKFARAKALC